MDAHSLGIYLRETREAKELTLENAVSKLKIRQRVLEAFERGDFDIPDSSPVQIRGFIRSYARYLGLDDDLIIQYYESALNNRHNRRRKARTSGKRGSKRKAERTIRVETLEKPLVAQRAVTDTRPTPPRVSLTLGEQRESSQQRVMRLLNFAMVIMVALAALAVIVLVAVQLIEPPDDLGEQEPRDILGQLPPTAIFTAAPTFTPRPTTVAQPQVQSDFTGRGVAVTIETEQRTWLRVLTDGNLQIERLVLPGELLDYRALNEIYVAASNARALNIVYNGQQQGAFGGRGQMVEITFTETDQDIVSGPGFDPTSPFTATPPPTDDQLAGTLIAAQTPSNTPGPSPTASDTPTITFTPSVTFTPSASPTASNTPTITPTPSATFTPSNTPTVTNTPTATRTPTITPTPSMTFTPSPTAILPPRTLNPTATKSLP
ncbi:MAG: hypothetical protein OHK0046_31670 [Anaerolineae bacterium]